MHHFKRLPRVLFVSVAVLIDGLSAAFAAESTWTQTTASSSRNWNDSVNWTNDFPNSAGDVANLNIDIAGSQTIRLRRDITLGVLNIGDADGSANFTIQNATGEGFRLIFDNGASAARINTTGVSNPTTLINAPLTLNSDLAVNLGGADTLNFGSGATPPAITTNNHNITFSGGINFATGINLNSDILGSGVITNNGNMAVSFSGTKSFEGTLVANKGIGGTNTGSFTLTNGSLANAGEFVINGYLTNGNTQNGGSIHAGSGTAFSSNPGQRLTTNTITLNGGSLRTVGQPATPNASGTPWQQGLEAVTDNVAVLKFNTGFSFIGISAAPLATASTAGTVLNVASVQRGAGGTGYVSSTTLTAERGSRFFVGNSASLLVGSGAASGTNMSIIPWLAAVNTNGSAQAPDGFATYTADSGIRALVVATEYATSITAGSTQNVNTNNLTFTGPTTVNSLRFTGGSSNIASNQSTGTGQVLTVTSGGVFMTTSNGTIGATGSVRAGTLDFGPAEGVIWSNVNNTNTIGAVITGSGGLTKAGTGTLILSGANTYGGTTIISGGTLQVGIGGVGRTGDGPMLLNAQGTVLAGTGTIQGAATVTAGQIRPGDAAGAGVGTLHFGGGLTFDPAAPATGPVTTVAELKILGAGSADKITIDGNLSLDDHSRLVVTLDPGYVPVEGDTWNLMDWTGLLTLTGFSTGVNLRDGAADDLTNLDLPTLASGFVWDISDFSGGGSLTLSVAVVPEPARAALLLCGMVTLLLRRRR